MTPLDVALHLLSLESDWRDPNPERRGVTARDHALQTASRAFRANASDEEVVCALLHDAARPLSDVYHGEVVAYILRGHVSEDTFNALYHHGTFQADLIHGTKKAQEFRGESWYPLARRLAGWDGQSFDPAYRVIPLSVFMPLLERTLGDGLTP
jgi:predicted HD phosphohydrolase